MWARKRIDIGWLDLLSGVANCLLPASYSAVTDATEAAWSADGHAFASLSVRTGFDLVLKALQLPAGSEVLISAITIPDMVRIIEHHGLVAVPIDLDPRDLSPKIEILQQAITPKTKAVLLAHLLGGRFDMSPFIQVARRHGLFVLEDCAQAFEGIGYRGNDQSDVSMFSFGPIKTATALGGGLFRIRDASLRARIKEFQSAYPLQSRWFFLKRVLFYGLLKCLGGRLLFWLFVRVSQLLGKNLDLLLNGSIRNFRRGDFFNRLRQQPSVPLLKLMARRISTFNHETLNLRAARGRLLVSLLPATRCPGSDSASHSFWIFPLQVVNQAASIAALQKAGFDSTASSSLRSVEPPADRPDLEPRIAKEILASTIYLPLYPAIPDTEIRRMAKVLSAVFNKSREFDNGILCRAASKLVSQ